MNELPPSLRWLLLGSLSLNLLLAMVLLGWAWRLPSHTPIEAEVFRELREPGSPLRWQRVLEPERRDVVRASLAPERQRLREAARAARLARTEVADALRSEPFDAARLQAALAEQRAREQAIAERVHAGLQRLATALAPEERQRLAERLGDSAPGRRRDRD